MVKIREAVKKTCDNPAGDSEGSRGFYEDEKYAMNFNPDWIFVADDDIMLNHFISVN
ncbi:MAG: hypothetical protein LUI85_08515 [Bacteroides sp.]|nr:hypothetical protein [Bacteroides sp.]